MHSRAPSAAETEDECDDYAGTTVESVVGIRNSWQIWKEKLDAKGLAKQIRAFASKHEDALVDEDQWRSKMVRRLAGKFDGVVERLDRMDARNGKIWEQLHAFDRAQSSKLGRIMEQQAELVHALRNKTAPPTAPRHCQPHQAQGRQSPPTVSSRGSPFSIREGTDA